MPIRVILLAIGIDLPNSKIFKGLVWSFFILVIIGAAFSVGLKYAETYTWGEAIWQVWQTMTTVGYGNKPPETPVGRAFTMIIATVGILLVPTFFGILLDYIVERRNLRRTGRMKNPYKNGVVVFNWPGVSEISMMIRELHAGAGDKELGICIVDSDLEQLPDSVTSLGNVHFVRGSYLNRETHEQANLQEAKTVIIFPKDFSSADSDGMTLSTTKLVEGYAGENTKVIPIIVDGNNEWIFKEQTSSTPIYGRLGILAAVQEAHDPFSAVAVQRILSNQEGANTRSFLANRIVGWRWRDFQAFSSQATENLKTKINPFAVVHEEGVNACPSSDTVISSGDRILVFAYNDLNWGQFEAELARCREEAHKQYLREHVSE